MCENGSDYADTVDPRVHIELERLNNATDEINRLEVELDECRAAFRLLLCESTAKVDTLRAKLGMCVERAKPYYEARFTANEALKQTQAAAMRYERANSAHSAAREMVYLAEQGLGGRTLDPAWQEMLNHATQRVNEAEYERNVAGQEHRLACVKHEATNIKVNALQKDLKRAITKSRPYFELKAQFNQMLEQQKNKVQKYESMVAAAKLTYADALHNLEQISDEIHRSRNNTTTDIDYRDDLSDISDEYKSLPNKLSYTASLTSFRKLEDVMGYKNLSLQSGELTPSESSGIVQSHSNEWTEISLEVSSPSEKPKLVRQKTMPIPKIEHEFNIKSKMKLDTTISNWISRSSVKSVTQQESNGRRQSLDNLLGPTSEKVKEIFSQGIMMLNISSLTERRNSEPKVCATEDNGVKGFVSKKLPSPLEKTMTYLTAEEDSSDNESLASVDMLSEDQINSLMLDKDLNQVCEQVLGTTISDVIVAPSTSAHQI